MQKMKEVHVWKIRLIYSDKSKCILTGKHRDIPLDLAKHYYNQYEAGKQCKVTYQQYPKRDYVKIHLFQKIEELESFEKLIRGYRQGFPCRYEYENYIYKYTKDIYAIIL